MLEHHTSELTMGQWVMGHRSNRSTKLGGSRGSRVSIYVFIVCIYVDTHMYTRLV